MPAATKTPGMNRPPTFDHLKKKQPRQRRVPVYLSDDAVQSFIDAEAKYERARLIAQGLSASGEVEADKDLEKFVEDAVRPEREAYEKARAELDAETAWLTFRSLGSKRYDELVREHPPTDKQNEEHREIAGTDAPYNVETFATALIAASCVEPKLMADQWQELLDEWNSAEVIDVFTAALEVNTQPRDPNLGKAYG